MRTSWTYTQVVKDIDLNLVSFMFIEHLYVLPGLQKNANAMTDSQSYSCYNCLLDVALCVSISSLENYKKEPQL